MSVGIEIEDLRKVYHSPPPRAAQGPRGPGLRGGADRSSRGKRKKIEIVALDSISLEIPRGAIFGLLGPNGAGKSTTVGILTTRVRATSGAARVGGYDVGNDPVAVKRLIGVVPQQTNLDLALTAREILLFHGAYFGLAASERHERAERLLDEFQLRERAADLTRGFSGGMSQRLAIARALVHDPQFLFLDEPTSGLDPQTRLLLWDLVREYAARGRTVLLTTHNMEEADTLCERIAIVDHGRILAEGTPAELKSQVPGGTLLRLRFDRDASELAPRLGQLAGVRESRFESGEIHLFADRGGPLVGEVVQMASASGFTLSELGISEPSLENLFLHYTGRSLRE